MSIKQWLSWMLGAIGIAAVAADWELPRDIGALPVAAPTGVWQFYAAPRTAGGFQFTAEAVRADAWPTLNAVDWNPEADRAMFHLSGQEVWSLPRTVIDRFGDAAGRGMVLLTAPDRDPVVVWTAPANGRYRYTCTLNREPQEAKGAAGNAMFHIAATTAGTERELHHFSWLDFERPGELTGEIDLQAGDRLFFRKTAALADDFGANACRVKLQVATVAPGAADQREWRGWFANSEATTLAQYRPAFESRPAAGVLRFTGNAAPFAELTTLAADRWHIVVRPEGDRLLAPPEGNVLIARRIAADGNYRLRLQATNPGPGDVTGGDGGALVISRLTPGSELDVVGVGTLALPVSGEGKTAEFDEVLRLEADDWIVFRFLANLDAYGDRFEAEIALTPTTEAGRELPAATPEALLPRVMPAAEAAVPGVPLRPGLFWLGVDGGWASSPFAEESVRLLHRFVPELLVIGVVSYPDRLQPKPAFYNELNIPTISQTWGAGYEPYFRLVDAFEYDWQGLNHAVEDGTPLSGTAHGAALPHRGFRAAFQAMGQSAMRRGDSGFGFCDMVWAWGPGRGAAGYHPETVAAFRADLAGTDEGLAVEFGDAFRGVMHFADYVRFYTGGGVTPATLGLTAWQEYEPLTHDQHLARTAAGENLSAHWLVFDMLTHYEWLKTAQFLGRVALAEGGFFQCMPNPEDLSNGCDWLFLAALRDVQVRSEEYFGSPTFLEGAYFRFPWFRRQTVAPRQSGIVLESGGGGNAVPYYTAPVSYMTSYEVALAAEADMLEGDFWVGHQAPLADTANANPDWLQRYQAILQYALGFADATRQPLRKPENQFVSYTSRRIFRTWGYNWFVWNYNLRTELSPEALLAGLGYVFEGRGEEALINDFAAAKLAIYAPSIPTRGGLEALTRRLESGEITDAFTFAECLEQVVDTDLATKPMHTVFPELSFVRNDRAVAGPVTADFAVATHVELPGTWQPEGAAAVWQVEAAVGAVPILLRRQIGAGTLHVLLFSPMARQAGGRAPATVAAAGEAVLEAWLAARDVRGQWSSPDADLTVRIYRAPEQWLVSALVDPLPQTGDQWDWRSDRDRSLRLKGCVPQATYEVRTWPDRRSFTAVADAAGDLALVLEKSAYLHFYIRPAGADWSDLETRFATCDDAMTLGGVVK